MADIVIVGGHGKVALLLEPLLVARGDSVRALIRNPDHAEEVRALGAEPVLADVENLLTPELADLFHGADAIVWSAGAGGGSADRTYAVDRDAAVRTIDAAEQAGVGRYVMVSYLGAGPDHGVDPDDAFYAYAEAKAAADQHLRRSELAWTIVAPGTLTLDPGTGRIEAGSPDDGTAPDGGSVPREDVAAVVAAVLPRPDTSGRFIGFVSGDVPIEDAVARAS
ncbi:SDR family oxidoreductase [Luteimicrobium subarcticum]|uniref:Putative NADH-flavin reductase n=1 Tax=Luteimicrobium subarcticum TaxID=620910 RepID=A0A2M8WS07_9MICO|nr:SDR family oxidoreductase [Luteimicrobium subarcticum]PJI93664.1 putative NADH-flavin reductase [Luteimicrobium subarcticum]